MNNSINRAQPSTRSNVCSSRSTSCEIGHKSDQKSEIEDYYKRNIAFTADLNMPVRKTTKGKSKNFNPIPIYVDNRTLVSERGCRAVCGGVCGGYCDTFFNKAHPALVEPKIPSFMGKTIETKLIRNQGDFSRRVEHQAENGVFSDSNPNFQIGKPSNSGNKQELLNSTENIGSIDSLSGNAASSLQKLLSPISAARSLRLPKLQSNHKNSIHRNCSPGNFNSSGGSKMNIDTVSYETQNDKTNFTEGLSKNVTDQYAKPKRSHSISQGHEAPIHKQSRKSLQEISPRKLNRIFTIPSDEMNLDQGSGRKHDFNCEQHNMHSTEYCKILNPDRVHEFEKLENHSFRHKYDAPRYSSLSSDCCKFENIEKCVCHSHHFQNSYNRGHCIDTNQKHSMCCNNHHDAKYHDCRAAHHKTHCHNIDQLQKKPQFRPLNSRKSLHCSHTDHFGCTSFEDFPGRQNIDSLFSHGCCENLLGLDHHHNFTNPLKNHLCNCRNLSEQQKSSMIDSCHFEYKERNSDTSQDLPTTSCFFTPTYPEFEAHVNAAASLIKHQAHHNQKLYLMARFMAANQPHEYKNALWHYALCSFYNSCSSNFHFCKRTFSGNMRSSGSSISNKLVWHTPQDLNNGPKTNTSELSSMGRASKRCALCEITCNNRISDSCSDEYNKSNVATQTFSEEEKPAVNAKKTNSKKSQSILYLEKLEMCPVLDELLLCQPLFDQEKSETNDNHSNETARVISDGENLVFKDISDFKVVDGYDNVAEKIPFCSPQKESFDAKKSGLNCEARKETNDSDMNVKICPSKKIGIFRDGGVLLRSTQHSTNISAAKSSINTDGGVPIRSNDGAQQIDCNDARDCFAGNNSYPSSKNVNKSGGSGLRVTTNGFLQGQDQQQNEEDKAVTRLKINSQWFDSSQCSGAIEETLARGHGQNCIHKNIFSKNKECFSTHNIDRTIESRNSNAQLQRNECNGFGENTTETWRLENNSLHFVSHEVVGHCDGKKTKATQIKSNVNKNIDDICGENDSSLILVKGETDYDSDIINFWSLVEPKPLKFTNNAISSLELNLNNSSDKSNFMREDGENCQNPINHEVNNFQQASMVGKDEKEWTRQEYNKDVFDDDTKSVRVKGDDNECENNSQGETESQNESENTVGLKDQYEESNHCNVKQKDEVESQRSDEYESDDFQIIVERGETNQTGDQMETKKNGEIRFHRRNNLDEYSDDKCLWEDTESEGNNDYKKVHPIHRFDCIDKNEFVKEWAAGIECEDSVPIYGQ